jgi:hypothetical protein
VDEAAQVRRVAAADAAVLQAVNAEVPLPQAVTSHLFPTPIKRPLLPMQEPRVELVAAQQAVDVGAVAVALLRGLHPLNRRLADVAPQRRRVQP